jgi:hypothetical protein
MTNDTEGQIFKQMQRRVHQHQPPLGESEQVSSDLHT